MQLAEITYKYSASDWLFIESLLLKPMMKILISSFFSEIKRDNGYEGFGNGTILC